MKQLKEMHEETKKCALPPTYQGCCEKCEDGPKTKGCMPCIGKAANKTCKEAGKNGDSLKMCVQDQIKQLKKMSEESEKCALPPMYQGCCETCADGPKTEGCMPCIRKAANKTCKEAGKKGDGLKMCVRDQIKQLKKSRRNPRSAPCLLCTRAAARHVLMAQKLKAACRASEKPPARPARRLARTATA
eukprot:TRINITY_DN4332_c0_g1_i1.p1 TRINITY_DN4332_c0_g1~~TRINITY_DN4332_c0_g1_i1.p1  ORF type:complete len:188 (-),score=44.10 TRINITY_DN4332_c0_g1_i1:91-654(-)